MKRPAKVVAGGVIAAGVIAGVVFYPRFVVEETSSRHICRVCGSYRVRQRTIVDGVEVSASLETLPSEAFHGFLADRHEHDWAFHGSNSETREGFGGVNKVACGFPQFTGRLPNRFTRQYNGSADFRAFVQARITAGDLSRELAADIVLLSDLRGGSEAASKARTIRAEFHERR